jgi:integrase
MIGFIAAKFSGHSLRAGLASSAEVDERYVQKQLGHVSAEMTRRYQRLMRWRRLNRTGFEERSRLGFHALINKETSRHAV